MRFHNALLGADTNNSWLRVVSALFLCLWAGPARKRVYMQGSVYQRGGGALAVNLDVQGVVRNQGLTVLRLDRAAGLLGRLWSWYAPRGVEGREGVARCSVAGFCGVLTRFGRVAEFCKGLVFVRIVRFVGIWQSFIDHFINEGDLVMRILLIGLVGLVLGCAGDDGVSPREARAELADLGIDYTAESFFQAAYEGDLTVVKLFVETGMSVNTRDGDSGATALIGAAFGGHLSVVQYLVKKGASFSARANTGATALHMAAFGGHLSVVRYLVGQGADVDARDNNGPTALHYAGGCSTDADRSAERRANCAAVVEYFDSLDDDGDE